MIKHSWVPFTFIMVIPILITQSLFTEMAPELPTSLNLLSSLSSRFSIPVPVIKSHCQWCYLGPLLLTWFDSPPPGQKGRHFAEDIFRCIFVHEKFYILIKISLKFVPKGPIDNNPPLVQLMAWHRIGNKPLSEPMLTRFIDAYMQLGGDELTLIPAWINNHMPNKVWDEITYPFLNFNDCTVEV